MEEKETKEIWVSITDPDNGFMSRENKQKVFCYLDHRTTDMKFKIITDVWEHKEKVRLNRLSKTEMSL